jgi:hypothetical protein
MEKTLPIRTIEPVIMITRQQPRSPGVYFALITRCTEVGYINKKIVLAGTAGGCILLISMYVFGTITAAIAPYDIALLGGMRAADDPVVTFFFLYPFVLSYAAAILFDAMKN